jgi:hypothetical protein
VIMMFLFSCKSSTQSEIRDNFESGSLDKVWSGDKLIPGALEFQSAVARSGNMAAKITLRQGDQIEEEKGTELERAELKEPKKLMSIENISYSYSFSIFLPPDFPIVPTRLVIAQWKQNCADGNCDPDNPVIALRYESGVLRVTLQTGPEKIILFTMNESMLNKWNDFNFRIRFSRNNDGLIFATLNGEEIIDFKGITAYTESYGYPFPGNFYFKIGLYRDTVEQPMSIYIDDYSKKQSGIR